jgi:hypothetical protein
MFGNEQEGIVFEFFKNKSDFILFFKILFQKVKLFKYLFQLYLS